MHLPPLLGIVFVRVCACAQSERASKRPLAVAAQVRERTYVPALASRQRLATGANSRARKQASERASGVKHARSRSIPLLSSSSTLLLLFEALVFYSLALQRRRKTKSRKSLFVWPTERLFMFGVCFVVLSFSTATPKERTFFSERARILANRPTFSQPLGIYLWRQFEFGRNFFLFRKTNE